MASGCQKVSFVQPESKSLSVSLIAAECGKVTLGQTLCISFRAVSGPMQNNVFLQQTLLIYSWALVINVTWPIQLHKALPGLAGSLPLHRPPSSFPEHEHPELLWNVLSILFKTRFPLWGNHILSLRSHLNMCTLVEWWKSLVGSKMCSWIPALTFVKCTNHAHLSKLFNHLGIRFPSLLNGIRKPTSYSHGRNYQ